MQKFIAFFQRLCLALLFISFVKISEGQSLPGLQMKDLAVWGGSSSASTFSPAQGIFIGNKVSVDGSLGSNHQIDVKNNFTLTGNIYGGNRISFANAATITGNVSAERKDLNYQTILVAAGTGSRFNGNISANGKVEIKTGTGNNLSTITGQVAVPAPVTTNYIGPVPSGGLASILSFSPLPQAPGNTSFDNQVGTIDITTTQPLAPGGYRKLSLTGNQTITFKGPGNYIFSEVNNIGDNRLIFDFQGTTEGTINLFIVGNARWGKLAVTTLNGNHPSRIYTELHGTGSTNSGFAFDVEEITSTNANEYMWLGNVWAPNGGITAKPKKASVVPPYIKGALWSGTKVSLEENLSLIYVAPFYIPSPINPYYQPPVTGKVGPDNLIGAELTALFQNPSPIQGILKNEIFRIRNDKVFIEVISKVPNDNILKSELLALGLTDTINNGPHTYVITGLFPINLLPQLNANSRIKYVRPLFPPLTNAGQVTTQGDLTMRSNNVRSRFGLDGGGVKVGVISDSYNSKQEAQNDVDQGDLPGLRSNGQLNENPEPVQILEDLLFPGNDEGRAMLQIVHDVSPQSKLAFRTGFYTAGDFAKGIEELADPSRPGGRCDIIVDDITYITEPFLRDGKVAQVVDKVVGQGVTYFSSAGNFGKKSYEGEFVGVTNTAVIPAPGQIHQFGNTPDQIYQSIKLKPGTYTIVLQWSDEFYSLGSTAGVQSDMDLYMVGMNGYTLFGFNRSNLTGDPFEVCPFTVTEETTAKIMVVRAAGNLAVRFKYIIFRGDGTILDYPGASSIVGHPNARGCIAVGAMLYDNIPQYTPIWPGVASFSSRGGTLTHSNTTTETRNKPELIGPNGVNTTVNLGGAVLNDGDAYPNFFGTSAAAPHVAAVGALLIQGRKKFNGQTTVTPGEIRQQLQSSAGKFSYLGNNFSFEGGYGYVQADSAIQQIANARPIVDSLKAATPGDQNGDQPFEIKVYGKYLADNTQIYFDGAPISSTTISADKTLATGIIPAIVPGEDPAIQLYNPTKSVNGNDGGLSEELHFFSSRKAVTIRAVNKSRKFGQANPSFTADVFIDGVPIEQTTITLASLKLDGNNISYSTIATPTSNIGLYGIFASRTTPLDNTDTLHDKYSFVFISGTLSIGKMQLKITPNNIKFKYGEYPGEITYQYEMDNSSATPPSLIEDVKALHKKNIAANALAVLNGFNNQNTASLDNVSAMTSFQAVRNARKFLLENGELQPLSNSISTSQIGQQRLLVDVSAQSLQNYFADPANANMLPPAPGINSRGLLNIKALTNGTAKASIAGGPQVPMINGQQLAMLNGQLQEPVNGQVQALINGVYVMAADMVFQSGQLLAFVNGVWTVVTNGRVQAIINGQNITVELSVQAVGQLQGIANGQVMTPLNGQLHATVGSQALSVINGQLYALQSRQLMPVGNGQLFGMVGGQLQELGPGQMVALINGQLMALVGSSLEIIQNLSINNGQIQAMVNGQIRTLADGELKVMLNGTVTNIPTTGVSLVNGQIQAMVNGQIQAMVNGQLMGMVNGQIQAMVNGDAVAVQSVRQLANGQIQAMVNGVYVPISNGQLQAMVNGQLMGMVNGQLMGMVNGQLNFVIFLNGQLQAMVNGQLQAMVNGTQLLAVANGQLTEVTNTSIVNGQLQAMVNNQTWVYPNNQSLGLVNGQLQAMVNNFDVTGSANNQNTMVIIDQDDINLQSGQLGGMFSINMITGLNAGLQTLIPGAFVNRNFDVSYGVAQVEILPTPLIVTADDVSKVYGSPNPPLTMSSNGFVFGDDAADITLPDITCTATATSPVGIYPVILAGGTAQNYSLLLRNGKLTIGKKLLTVRADDKTRPEGTANPLLTISYDGLVGTDTKDIVCAGTSGNSITASTTADLSSSAGVYPITLQGCSSYNPNYNVVLMNGTLTITGCTGTTHLWKGDGNFNDAVGGANGTAVGGVSISNVAKVGSGSFSFNGKNGYISTGTSGSVSGTGYFSVSAWIKTTSTASMIIINQRSVNNDGEYILKIGGTNSAPFTPGAITGKAYFVVYSAGSNIADLTSTNLVNDGNWHFIRGERDGLTVRLYVDGVLQASGNTGRIVPLDGTISTFIGKDARANASYFNGLIDEIKVSICSDVAPTTRLMASPVTGIAKTSKPTENKLYPNPVSSVVSLQLVADINPGKDIQAFDGVGKRVFIHFTKTGEGTYNANVAALAKGIYFIKVTTGTGTETFRFIKG